MGFEAHQIIYSAQEKYNENDLNIKQQSAGTFFGCEPVIAERGLSGASDFMGFTVKLWHSQAT